MCLLRVSPLVCASALVCASLEICCDSLILLSGLSCVKLARGAKRVHTSVNAARRVRNVAYYSELGSRCGILHEA
jgi:hypothetical protein